MSSLDENVLQLKIESLYKFKKGKRFDMDIETFRRSGESETTWEDVRGKKNKLSVWVRLVRPWIGSSGEAILFHWTDNKCSSFSSDLINENRKYRITKAIPDYWNGSTRSPYQIKLDRNSVIQPLD